MECGALWKTCGCVVLPDLGYLSNGIRAWVIDPQQDLSQNGVETGIWRQGDDIWLRHNSGDDDDDLVLNGLGKVREVSYFCLLT